MLIAEQAAPTSWIEHLLAGTYTEELVRKDAILNFETAREQGFLEERGMEMLACLYWSAGDVRRSSEIMDALDTCSQTHALGVGSIGGDLDLRFNSLSEPRDALEDRVADCFG